MAQGTEDDVNMTPFMANRRRLRRLKEKQDAEADGVSLNTIQHPPAAKKKAKKKKVSKKTS
jgi:hypothetical protein